MGYGVRLFTILRNPLIYGIDGPWYVTQVKSVVENGAPSEAGMEPLVLYFAGGASVFVNDATLWHKNHPSFLFGAAYLDHMVAGVLHHQK